MKKTRFFLLLTVFTVVLALQVLPACAVRNISAYHPIYEGIEYAEGYADTPQLMRAFAFRIDLLNPNVSLFTTPGNGADPYDTNLQTTPQFLSTYGCEVAMNANWSLTYSPYSDVEGVLVSNGTIVSEWSRIQGSLRFTADKTPSFHYGEVPWDPTGYHTVVSGSWLCLADGGTISDGTITLAPRSSVGISQDNRYLIMVVVDGRQSGWSEGATFQETGQWQLDFGAWNAIHMDGGGSSCICTASGGVLNRPSDGSPRLVGSNFGVNSIPIPGLEIIIDNPDGTCSGNWSTGTTASGKYGSNYRYRSTAAVSDPFTWTPNVTTAGDYEVFAWWPSGISKAASNAPYIINYNGGTQTVYCDQRVNGGRWNSLGVYNFAAGTSGNVQLSCWTTLKKTVTADAIRLFKQ